MTKLTLKGIIPPNVIPLKEGEKVDEPALVRQLSRLLDAGVHGLYYLGSTGEFPVLREAERRRAIEIGRRVIGDRAPMIVGTMDSGTERAIDNIKMAEDLGADAVAVCPAFYYPPHDEGEILLHYEKVAASTRLPVVVYNFPQTTKVMIHAETVFKIAEIENVIGVKDSSGDWPNAFKLIARFRRDPDFSVLIAARYLIGPALMIGADGVVVSTANIDPKSCLDFFEACLQQDVDEMFRLHDRLDTLTQILSYGSPVSCIKAALEIMGVCSSTACAPFAPVSDEARAGIRQILSTLSLL